MDNSSNIKCLYCSYSYDSSLLAIGTETGYMIWKVNPFTLITNRTLHGGIGHIEILRKTNILALIGGGSYPNYPPEYVVFYDDKQAKSISKLKFKSTILKIKLGHKHLFVIFENKILIFNIETLTEIDNIDTVYNIKVIFALSTNINFTMIAYPSLQTGKVIVKNINHSDNEQNNHYIEFWAHSSEIGCLGMSKDGSLICTASRNGTIIRVFNSITGKKGFEFRRGSDNAIIINLEFNWNNSFILCTSNKETIHVFRMTILNNQINKTNDDVVSLFSELNNTVASTTLTNITFQDIDTHQGFLGSLKRYLIMPKVYITGQRSFAYYKHQTNRNTFCFFVNDDSNEFIIFNKNVTVLKRLKFDLEKGGIIKLSSNMNIINGNI